MIKMIAMLLSVILALTGCAGGAGSASQPAAGEDQNTSEGAQGYVSGRTEIPRVDPTQAEETESTAEEETEPEDIPDSGDIMIIYTGNVRCGVNDGIGYAGVAALKKELGKNNAHVALIDCGDASWGAEIGEASEGLYIIDIMNHMGYDLAALGDRDLSYGMEALAKNMDQANYPYIACNLSYTGKDENMLTSLCAYVIEEYGDIKVAYIGAITPDALTGEAAELLEEDGTCAYDMCAGDGSELYECVQTNIDAVMDEGADYVVLVSHLGTGSGAYGADAVAANTSGLDAIIDAPSDTAASDTAAAERIVKNADGENVLLAQMDGKLSSVGVLTITSGGNIISSAISEYPDKDVDVQSVIDGLMVDSGDAQEASSDGGK